MKGFTICETQATTIRVKVAWKIRSRRISGALRDFDLMTASQMTIPAMLDALASEEEGLPWPAIQFARENWEEVGPALIDVLNAFVEKKDCSERAHVRFTLCGRVGLLGAQSEILRTEQWAGTITALSAMW